MISVATDRTVLYSNEADEPLLHEWRVAAREKLPPNIGDFVIPGKQEQSRIYGSYPWGTVWGQWIKNHKLLTYVEKLANNFLSIYKTGNTDIILNKDLEEDLFFDMDITQSFIPQNNFYTKPLFHRIFKYWQHTQFQV